MKYVIFTNIKTGLSLPVFCSNHLTHASMSAGPGFLATSAGFYDPKTCRAFGESDSLELKSRKGDFEICGVTLAAIEHQIFLVQDLDENLDRVEERTMWLKEKIADAESDLNVCADHEKCAKLEERIEQLKAMLGDCEVAK